MSAPFPSTASGALPLGENHAAVENLRRWILAGLIGRKSLVERLMIALLTGGHVLIEGAPGLAKTRAVKRLAEGVSCQFARLQCTPDLLPSDLTGTNVFRPDHGGFEFIAGPLFHSLILVDEINRAPPKVQSALLEAMAEAQVTVAGETRPLPNPFMVVATQNPIEQEGTFPLPEAQLDRFQMHVLVDYPDSSEERAILDLVDEETSHHTHAPAPLLDKATILAGAADVARVHLSPTMKDYIVRLVMATREPKYAPDVRKSIAHPVSPRGTLALAAAVRARAYLQGRDFGLPEDAVELGPDVLAHRLIPTWQDRAEGVTARSLIARLIDAVPPL